MIEELKKLIQDKKIIPFVGAGVSREVKSKNNPNETIFPTWNTLLSNMTEELKTFGDDYVEKAQFIESAQKLNRNYLQIADFIKEYYPTEQKYYNALQKEFDKKKSDICTSSLELLNKIWTLNSKLIITTNYDKSLLWASPVSDTKFWDIQSIQAQASSLRDGVKHETVWHLHGHIDTPENLILTTDSYNKLYDTSHNKHFKSAYITLLSQLLNKSFLFIGYSLDDEFLVNELEKIFNLFDDNLHEHYILLKRGKELPKRFNKKIIPIYYDNHGQDLIDLILSLTEKSEALDNSNNINFDNTVLENSIETYNLTSLPPENKDFIGRKEELLKLEELLKDDQTVYVVNGIGGVGKSELSYKYLHNNKQKYDNIAFVEMSTDSSIEETFLTKFKDELQLDEYSTLETVIQRLQRRKGRNLLLIDNIEKDEDFKKIEPLNTNFDLLITTRINLDTKYTLNLETLNDKDAKALFLSLYDKDEKIDDILEYLDNHPLFINLTAKSLNLEYITLEELRSNIENNSINKIDSTNDKTFEEHLQDTFNKQFINEKNKELKELLQYLSIFPSIEIDFNTLEQCIGIDKLKVKLQKLVDRGWLIKKENSYKLHQIIKTFIVSNYYLKYDDSHFILNNIAKFINPLDGSLIINHLISYIPIIESIIKIFQQNKDNYIASLYDSLTYLYYHLSQYTKAMNIQNKSLSLREDLFGDNSNFTALSYDLLSRLIRFTGNYKNALEYQLKALNIRKIVKDSNPYFIAHSYNILSLIYLNLEQYHLALDYQKKAIEIRENTTLNNSDLYESYTNLAAIYQSLEKYNDALHFTDKSINILNNETKKNQILYANSYNNLGTMYANMGKLRKALTYYNKSIKIKEDILPSTHSDLALGYLNISSTYIRLKECVKAKYYVNLSLTIYQNLDYIDPQLNNTKNLISKIESNIKKQQKSKFKDKGRYCIDL